MLHIVVGRHDAETCPASRKDIRETFLGELRRIEEVAGALGAAIAGSWSDMTGHVIYLVVEAPNAHVVQEIVGQVRLMDWSTVDVSPIVTLSDALTRIGDREPLM